MKIVNLIENTEGATGCAYEHGLSFYVDTPAHKLLLDLGPSESTIDNAAKLGIDLSVVDTVVLSHGHYDHSGGIIPFVRNNNHAVIYMQDTAGGDYYADDKVLNPGSNAENAGDGSAKAGSGTAKVEDGDFKAGSDAENAGNGASKSGGGLHNAKDGVHEAGGISEDEARYRYIGIDKAILELPQVKLVHGDYKIDDELELFTIKNRTHPLPFTNKRLLKKGNDGFERDDFAHEHFLVINDGEKKILMSGCAHNGILSILDAFIEKYGKEPDIVISGFHLKLKRDYREHEMQEITDIAKELNRYQTKFYTCHCTGVPAFEAMKEIMGDRLKYVHSGDLIALDQMIF